MHIFEFHIAEHVRKKYQIDESLFTSTGNIIFPNFRTVREVTARINDVRSSAHAQQEKIRAGQLNAMGLLDEINHFLVRIYEEQVNPGVMERAYKHICSHIGKSKTERTVKHFLKQFPPTSVYTGKESLEKYFEGSSSGRSHHSIALEEMVMLYIANFNPANASFKEFFDDANLSVESSYAVIIESLEKFFLEEKPFGPDNQFLFEALKAPILSNPHSLEAQLGYLKNRWGILLSSKYFDRIALSLELSKEEDRFLWNQLHGGGTSSVETFVPNYKQHLSEEERIRLAKLSGVSPEDFIYAEPERFTTDLEWMPNVVIIAKNTYVWLDQLSKKYQREIRRLDQIPDAELDQLAKWNFTGLWLIGVWERSNASKRIKQLTGNGDAVSSAYSLFDYEIAADLGGEDAFQNLNHRAWHRGIRLAGDMVPNHMGLFSKWILEHPEYFIQSEKPPYPNYRFTGHNLSDNPDIELRIEDGYWSRSDAAVVFQRIDKRNGEVRYIYHGNDGTNMPWNDTAQLNLLRADVREAILQNIFHVARKFSIIRFDAAMTLAKKHYQRLWYPMPGTSGVPSRQDNGMSRADFDAQFPNEFWREVVDRCNAEMPNTLLLAEAFWLMEGYFVRTLGMHRVYNSAFMHMLMKEENDKFRALIKNTLEFNPEILKRYVNFMSNPDEQTAIAQFGSGDKYFGIATMMVTLPGLPMFAHGQIEGFTEKYGMEYQRAYYNEHPNDYLVRRHETEIFPLMKRRYLFSNVQHFESFDFHDDRGFVNENVFVYSNRAGEERTLIFFHNKFEETHGRIHSSNAKIVGNEKDGVVRQIHIADAMQFKNDENTFYIFREHRTNNEFLRSGKEIWERGFELELRAFEYAVFLNFREVHDSQNEYKQIAQQLRGRGTANILLLLTELQLKPVHEAIRLLFKPEFIERIISQHCEYGDTEALFFSQNWMDTAQIVFDYAKIHFDKDEIEKLLQEFFDGKKFIQSYYSSSRRNISNVLIADDSAYALTLYIIFQFLLLIKNEANKNQATTIIEDLRLFSVVKIIVTEIQHSQSASDDDAKMIFVVLKNLDKFLQKNISLEHKFDLLFEDFETASYLNIHQHNSTWYLNKERFERSVSYLHLFSFFKSSVGYSQSNKNILIDSYSKMQGKLFSALSESSYELNRFKEHLSLFPSEQDGFEEGKNQTARATNKNNSITSNDSKGGKERRNPIKKK